ncbi:MAG: nuclear transport factor 2 family protein [Bacteroidota bacterium]
MNRIFLAFIMLSCSITGWTQTREESEVVALSKKKFRWMVEAKLDSLDGLLDERLSYIHSTGWTQSKKEFIEDFTNGKITYHSIEVKEISARVYKRSAVVTGTASMETTLNGNRSPVNVKFTEVYVLQKGGWKLVSRHASRLP